MRHFVNDAVATVSESLKKWRIVGAIAGRKRAPPQPELSSFVNLPFTR
jgi:hypothetical protein